MKKIKSIYALTLIFLAFCVNNTFSQKKAKIDIAVETLSEYAFIEGMKEFSLGNYGKALSLMENHAKTYPNHSGTYHILSKIYSLDPSTIKVGIKNAEKALELSPNNLHYYLLLSELFERDKNYDQAAKTMQKMLKNIPNTDQYALDLASYYMMSEKYEDAIKAFIKAENAIGISPEITKQKQQLYLIDAFPQEDKYIVELAQLYFNNNKNKEAIELLEGVLKKKENSYYARLVLHDIFNQGGQKEKAREQLNKAFEAQDWEIEEKISILINYGRSMQEEDVKKFAFSLTDALIKAHPESSKSYLVTGDLHQMADDKAKALSYYKKALKFDESQFVVWQQIIANFADLNQTDSMIYYSDKAIETFPNQATLYFYSGTGQLMKKRYKEAIVKLEKGRKLSTTNLDLQAQIDAQLGDSYNAISEHKKSDASYEAALKQNPENIHVLNNYSYFLSLRNENLDKAKNMSYKTILAFPNESTYLDTYAWILYVKKEYKEALKFIEKAAENSKDGTIFEHYGDVLFQLGKKDEALIQWKKAKDLGELSDKLLKKIADKNLYE